MTLYAGFDFWSVQMDKEKHRPPWGSVLSDRLGRYDGRAERHQCELGEFEALLSERDSDDGDAQDKPHDCCRDGELDSPENEPQDIDKQGKRTASVHHALPEWRKHQSRHFEALETDRNSDDRDAP